PLHPTTLPSFPTRRSSDLPDPNAPIDPEFLAASGPWLHDYALFEALTRAHGGAPFWQWPPPLRDRSPEALAQAAHELAPDIARIDRKSTRLNSSHVAISYA